MSLFKVVRLYAKAWSQSNCCVSRYVCPDYIKREPWDIPEGYEEEYDKRGFRIIKSGKTKIKYVSVEDGLRYIMSEAYKHTYGNDPIWKNYRRNFWGQFPPRPRKRCTRDHTIMSASPCPLCRDQYLVLDYRNVYLLQQFISKYTGEIFSPKVTGLCLEQDFAMRVQIHIAHDFGFLNLKQPTIEYKYKDWYPFLRGENENGKNIILYDNQ